MKFDLIDVGAARFEAMHVSEAPPAVVVLPTSSGGIRFYAAFLEALAARGLPALAINPRGCGASTGALEGLSFHDLAQDAIAVVEAVAAGPVILAGHAGGNRIARLAARLRPELFSGVVLLAAGGRVAPEPEALAALARLADAGLSDDERRKLIRQAFFARASEIGDAYLRPVDMSADFARAFLAANDAIPLDDWWGGGPQPMLVIQGREDRMAPPANGHELRDRFPDRVRLVDLDDAGHMIPMERPDEAARLITRFAEELTAR